MSKFQKGDRVQHVKGKYTGTVRKAIAYSDTRYKYNIKWDTIEGTFDGELKTEEQLQSI